KLLKIMVNLEDHSDEQFSELDRLKVNATYQEILGVPIRKVTIPVAAGRNLAVLVEAAVRNFVLNQRGIDSTQDFIERQQKLVEDTGRKAAVARSCLTPDLPCEPRSVFQAAHSG